MTNRDDLQRDLQALLTGVSPSTAFAAAVRTRVAEDDARRSRRVALAWGLGGAVCLGSLAWGLAPRRPAVASVPSASATIAAAVPEPQAPPAVTRLAVGTDQPLSTRPVRLGIPRRAPADVAAAPAHVAAVNDEAGGSRVLVPDDQRIALVYLLQRLHQGRATVPATIVPAYDKDGLLVPPEPIVIAPLASLALPNPDDRRTPEDPKEPGKDKQR
jgi:hypothetical protein